MRIVEICCRYERLIIETSDKVESHVRELSCLAWDYSYMRFEPRNWRRKEARSFLPFQDRELSSRRVDKIFKNIACFVSSTRSSFQGSYDIFRIYRESIFLSHCNDL